MGDTVPESVLSAGPVDTIPEVITRLEAIRALAEKTQPLGERDGVASFTRIYGIVSKNVFEKIGKRFFPDEEFLDRLDVSFANRYLAALRAYHTGTGRVPKSWKVLIERRSMPDVTPLQFAVAGVNAHINFDLAPAVVATCEELGRKPTSGGQKRSYDRVNDIFAEEMGKIREHLQGQLLDWIDAELGRADDIVGEWSIEAARGHAWNVALMLWSMREFDFGEDVLLETQDQVVGLAGHLLLRSVR